MADVNVKPADSKATRLEIDGAAYDVNEQGYFLVPEESLHRVLDLGVGSTPFVLTAAQINSLVVAKRVNPGDSFYCSGIDAPIWRNAANDGWVDGVGDVVALS